MSGQTAAVVPPAADAFDALAALRRARRRARVASIHWIDALYNVYLVAVLGGIAVLAVSGWVGDGLVDAATLDRVRADGPAVAGLVLAVALAVGMRSGSRGGPLAIEGGDVRHVLLAPLDRGHVLRGPALRQLRFASFVGAVTGAVAGQFAVRRLGGSPVAWVAAGTAFGAVVAVSAYGTGFLFAGRRLRPGWSALGAVVLVAWAVADVAGRGPTAPTSAAGALALWPLSFDPWALVAVVVLAAVVAAGVAGIGGLSLEAAERRSALIGQLRFAVTLQDLRTVIVLRRQLAQEHSRVRPWIRVRAGRAPVWRRDWQGMLRYPLARLGRIALLGVVAGLSLGAMWAGTTAMLVVAALALFVAGLDLTEPIAQEIDHSDRGDLLPREMGALLVAHLPAMALATVPLAVVVGACWVAVEPGPTVAVVAALLALPVTLAGLAGALVSTLMGSNEPSSDNPLLPPEVAGMRLAARTAWPPIVSALGGLAVLGAREAGRRDGSAVQAAAFGALWLAALLGMVAAWVRFREPAKAWWRRTMEEAQAAQGASARKPAGGPS